MTSRALRDAPAQAVSPRAARPRKVVVLARPGAGKSTQAARLAARLGVEHLSSGSMIRGEIASGSALGRLVAPLVERGELVPDDLVLSVVEPALERALTGRGGYVLDGYPRDLAQAQALDALGAPARAPLGHGRAGGDEPGLALSPDLVLWLDVGPDECRRRLLGRAATDARSDDTERTVERRLVAYERETAPVRGYYEGAGIVVVVDGAASPDEVEERVAAAAGAT